MGSYQIVRSNFGFWVFSIGILLFTVGILFVILLRYDCDMIKGFVMLL